MFFVSFVCLYSQSLCAQRSLRLGLHAACDSNAHPCSHLPQHPRSLFGSHDGPSPPAAPPPASIVDVAALLQQLMLQEAQQQASSSTLLGQQVGL